MNFPSFGIDIEVSLLTKVTARKAGSDPCVSNDWTRPSKHHHRAWNTALPKGLPQTA